MVRRVLGVEVGEAGRYRQSAAGRHRIARVDRDVAAERAAEQPGGARYQRVDVDFLRLQRLAAREHQHVTREIGAPFGGLSDRVDFLLGLDMAGHILAQQIEVADDDREQIVEIVSDAAGQIADRFHLLRLPKLIVELLALGHVLDHAQHVQHFRHFGCARRSGWT